MRYLDAVAGRPLDRPPVWLMRQAGRYLPEYRATRSRVSFQEAVSKPDIAAKITLQPLKRFDLDAAIVFADIMTPLESMGIEVSFDPGPKLDRPVQSAARLDEFDPDGPAAAVPETIKLVRAELSKKAAMIGFCGAPFTLAAYLCGGGGGEFGAVRALAHSRPAVLAELLEKLADAMCTYLFAQISAGADAVQIFDSWAGLLSSRQFADLNVPVLEHMITRVRKRAPVTYFAPDAAHLDSEIGGLGADVVGVDWRRDICEAWDRIGAAAIQGNLDPAVLVAGPQHTREATLALLERTDGRAGHIVNLGHGIRPETPVESVAELVDCVTSWPDTERDGSPNMGDDD